MGVGVDEAGEHQHGSLPGVHAAARGEDQVADQGGGQLDGEAHRLRRGQEQGRGAVARGLRVGVVGEVVHRVRPPVLRWLGRAGARPELERVLTLRRNNDPVART